MNSFTKNYLAFLCIASCFLIIIGFFSYTKFKASHIQSSAADHNHQVIKDILKFNAQVIEMTAGYSQSGQTLNQTNAKYNQALSLITSIIDRSAADPSQQARAIKVEIDFKKLMSSEHVEKDQKIMTDDIDKFIKIEDREFDSHVSSLMDLDQNFYIAVLFGSFAAFSLLMYMNYYLLQAQNREASIQKRFEEIKERQAQSFQATQDGMFEWNLQNQSMYWSPRLKEMIGYQDHELEASSEMLEHHMHPEDRESFWQQLHRHLKGELAEYSSMFRWHHKDGRWVWIHARGRASFNDLGDPVILMGVHTDITPLKEYEIQLSRSRDEAEKANNAKNDFMAHMSHEIRTPLTAITGVSEILTLQKSKFDEKTQRLLSALNASAISLKDLISDILDYSKIESGRIVLDKKEINLLEFFEELEVFAQTKAAAKNLSLAFDYKSVEHIHIIGDPLRLRQIMINLLGNAIKFTSNGKVTVHAFLSHHEKEFLQVDVIDTGIGIPEDKLARIFDSFKQADESASRKYGGTGLGLPIAQHLARLMGGGIFATSQIDQGSVFTLRIPLNIFSNVMKTEKKEPAYKNFNFGDQNKILVVEDYEGTIAFITHILDEMNIEYDLGRTGLEGLKLWSENTYKLVLMDIQMPEMDGISTVKHIRRIESEKSAPRTPIIAMTAHAFSEGREKCLTAGFDEYLPKPLSKEALFEKIDLLFNQAK